MRLGVRLKSRTTLNVAFPGVGTLLTDSRGRVAFRFDAELMESIRKKQGGDDSGNRVKARRDDEPRPSTPLSAAVHHLKRLCREADHTKVRRRRRQRGPAAHGTSVYVPGRRPQLSHGALGPPPAEWLRAAPHAGGLAVRALPAGAAARGRGVRLRHALPAHLRALRQARAVRDLPGGLHARHPGRAGRRGTPARTARPRPAPGAQHRGLRGAPPAAPRLGSPASAGPPRGSHGADPQHPGRAGGHPGRAGARGAFPAPRAPPCCLHPGHGSRPQGRCPGAEGAGRRTLCAREGPRADRGRGQGPCRGARGGPPGPADRPRASAGVCAAPFPRRPRGGAGGAAAAHPPADVRAPVRLDGRGAHHAPRRPRCVPGLCEHPAIRVPFRAVRHPPRCNRCPPCAPPQSWRPAWTTSTLGPLGGCPVPTATPSTRRTSTGCTTHAGGAARA